MCWGRWEKALEESTCLSMAPANPGPSQRWSAIWVPSLLLLCVPPPFYFQVCRPSPFQHLLSVMHSRMGLFAFFISSGHWPFTSICVPGSGDLGSWTEAPWRGEVLSTEKPSGYFHYFWQSLWTCTYGPSPPQSLLAPTPQPPPQTFVF